VKVCKTCGVEKPLSEFYAAKNPASSHTGKAWARGECKECLLAKQSAQYTANPEPKREAARRQRESLPAEKRREYNRRYYERHREEIRQRAKEYGWTARWQAANPERRRANEAKRKAVMRQTATGTVDYAAILRTYGYVCHICGGTIAPSEIEFDHVIPLSLGGTHTQDNIRPAHQQCNRRKYNKLLETVEAASAEQLQPIDCTVSSVRDDVGKKEHFSVYRDCQREGLC
jgi:5-methylcytosine-specific restriction endonuclease McrA